MDAVGNWETPDQDQQVIVQVTAGGDHTGPQIGTPVFASSVASDQPLMVTADINDALTGGHGVASATLYYGYAAPYNGSQVAGTGPGGNGDGTWEFVIPAQGSAHEGETLKFFITAWDGDATPASTTEDNGGAYFAVTVTAGDEAGPRIGTPSFDSTVLSSTSLTVTADISDAPTGGHGVATATLYYGYTAPYNGSQVAGTGPGGNGDGVWRFAVPPQGEGHVDDTLYFFMTAQDGDETPATTTNNNGGNYFQVQIVASESKTYLPLVMRNHQR